MCNNIPCKLCGLPVRKAVPPDHGNTEEQFCCQGCKMVHTMIMESDDYKDVQDFTQTDIFKRCVSAGVIPDPNEVDPKEQKSTERSLSTQDQFTSPMDDSENLTWHFSVSNMWCPACAWIIEESMLRTDGIISATCNFSSDRGKVLYNPVKTAPEAMKKRIARLGYRISELDSPQGKNVLEFVRLSLISLLTMNIMMFSWSIYSGFLWEFSEQTIRLLSWPVWVMATIVLIFGGFPVHKKAIAGIRSGAPGMEVLISIGSITAYIYSVINVFQGGLHLYFDASSMLILLILIGKKLENSAKSKIAQSLSEFMSLAPEKVKICNDQFPNGRYVSVKQLDLNDEFICTEGEIIAADGFVIEGTAIIDESSITGEPKPISVELHNAVKSGTRLMSGRIKIEATGVAEQSILGKMMTAIESSLSGKTRQSVSFERLLKYFVPSVISLSVLTYFASILSELSSFEAISRGLSVMVISCPCALGIAIPLALVAGVSISGRSGIVVRDLEAFEKIEGLNCYVFDKTGTLTTGKMSLLGIATLPGYNKEQVLSIAQGLEKDSLHFIAKAILNYCDDHNIPPVPIHKIKHASNGISGEYESRVVKIGNKAFIGDLTLPNELATQNDQRNSDVLTEVFLTIDGKIISSFQFGDRLKEGIPEFIDSLKTKGLKICLISGDAPETTINAGRIAGIESKDCAGGLLPHEKAEFIQRLKATGFKTAMVGDGMNDAPALTESDLAVAVHSGLNAGKSVASITLMKEDPRQILDFFERSKLVNKTVKQNLIFAFAYNMIGIPIAGFGLLNPIIAVTAMLCSSLSVTFNTLRMVKKGVKTV